MQVLRVITGKIHLSFDSDDHQESFGHLITISQDLLSVDGYFPVKILKLLDAEHPGDAPHTFQGMFQDVGLLRTYLALSFSVDIKGLIQKWKLVETISEKTIEVINE